MQIKFIGIFLCLLSLPSFAEPDKTCWENPPNKLVAEITNLTITGNKKGDKGIAKYGTSPNFYSSICNNLNGVAAKEYFLKGDSVLPPSEINRGYYKLSDDLDIKIKYQDGRQYYTVPFENLGQKDGIPIPQGSEVRIFGMEAGGNGEVELILRRDIIGGAIIIPSEIMVSNLFRKFGLYNNYGEYAHSPVIEVYTRSQVIPVPVLCSINGGAMTNIEFGNIDVNEIPADTYMSKSGKEASLFFQCNEPISQAVKVNIIGTASSFRSDSLISDNPDVAFAIFHKGKVISPLSGFPSSINNGYGNDVITVSPVKNPNAKEIRLGDINSSATLILTLP